MTDRTHPSDRRPLFRGVAGAAVVVLATVLTGCAGATSVPAATTEVTGTTQAATVTTNGPTEPTVGPELMLSEAIAAVGSRYQFDTSVELTGGTLTLVSGRVYDDSSAYLITTVGSEVEYVITPNGRWVREPESAWVPLQDGAPLTDPLAVLGSPLVTEVLNATGSAVTLSATYDGAAVGLPDANTVVVDVVITNGRLTSLSYQAPAGADMATVTTEIGTSEAVAPVEDPTTG